jgi:hypothetical protein
MATRELHSRARAYKYGDLPPEIDQPFRTHFFVSASLTALSKGKRGGWRFHAASSLLILHPTASPMLMAPATLEQSISLLRIIPSQGRLGYCLRADGKSRDVLYVAVHPTLVCKHPIRAGFLDAEVAECGTPTSCSNTRCGPCKYT